MAIENGLNGSQCFSEQGETSQGEITSERLECIEEMKNREFGCEDDTPGRSLEFEYDINPMIQSLPSSPSKLENRGVPMGKSYDLRARTKKHNWLVRSNSSGRITKDSSNDD